MASNYGSENINIYGPPNTVNLIEAMRYFFSRRKLLMTTKEFRDTSPECPEYFEDEHVRVHPILLIDEEQLEQFTVKFPSTPLQTSTELRNQDDLALASAGLVTKPASNIQILEDTGFGLKKGFKMQNRNERTPFPQDWKFPPRKSYELPLRKLTVDTMPLNSVVCYAIQLRDTPGKFDVKKADALGVPPKQRSTLVKGESLTLPNGTIVQPSECIGPSIPGKIIIIVDIPNIGILKALLKSQSFARFQSGGKDASQLACIVHLTPSDILTSSGYQNWMNSFSDSAEHLVSNTEHCASPHVFRSSARLQMMLNKINENLFPLPHSETTPKLPLPTSTETEKWPSKMTSVSPLMRFGLAPHNMVGIDRSMQVPDLTMQEVETTFNAKTELVAGLPAVHAAVSALPARPPLSQDPVDILFLGTGSATPSKYRNQSGTYINIRGWGGFLLDAGEGSLGQLARHFGPQLNDALANLKAVFISHMHADHHLGLLRVMLHRQVLTREPLLIIGPPRLCGWLFEYSQVEYLNYTISDNYELLEDEMRKSAEIMIAQAASESASSSVGSSDQATYKPGRFDITKKSELMQLLNEKLGLKTVTTAPVIHCVDAFGIAIEHQDGWKITFSGDTRPVQTLVDAGMDSTLLIHEATFEDGLSDKACNKGHATTSEAIAIANEMNAKFLMMTHFSQRYPKIPVFDTSKGKSGAGIAFDLMRLRFSDFDIIPILTNSLQLLFADPPQDEEDDDDGLDLD